MINNSKNTALTLAVGRAGDETAVRGSFGFEFGGQRSIQIPVSAIAPAAAPEPEVVYVTAARTAAVNDSAFDVEALVADLTDEQYEELQRQIRANDDQYELVEQRQAQQKNLIETQQQQLERLRREAEVIRKEAEALRLAEEKRKAEEEASRQKFAQRLASKGDSK